MEGKSGTYGSQDRALPLEHVVADRTSAARCGRVMSEVDQFLLQGSRLIGRPIEYSTVGVHLVKALEGHGIELGDDELNG